MFSMTWDPVLDIGSLFFNTFNPGTIFDIVVSPFFNEYHNKLISCPCFSAHDFSQFFPLPINTRDCI